MTPIGILLGHIVCKDGIKVDFAKIKIILDLKPPINPKQVRVLLGHTGYYTKFIRHYSNMIYPLEELLKEYQQFKWTEECQISFDKLKRKLVEAPILKFPNWSTKFHVHIDASGIAIGAILTQPGDDGMDYPIVYSSRKLNKAERNCSTTEREALGMVFALQKYQHYLLANPLESLRVRLQAALWSVAERASDLGVLLVDYSKPGSAHSSQQCCIPSSSP